MFKFLKKTKKTKETLNNHLFRGNGIVDVTNFDAMSPDDSLGYMCDCIVTVFGNGQIDLYSVDEKNDLLESFSVVNIVRANNNINNFDPLYTSAVSMTTESKNLIITFQTEESKLGFCKALATVYDNLKESN